MVVGDLILVEELVNVKEWVISHSVWECILNYRATQDDPSTSEAD